MSRKFALIIGNTDYIDPGLAQLTAPGKDAEDFARVLRDPGLCAFDHVNILLNQLSSTVVESIDEFFDQKKPDDLLVLYFSGHGVRDEFGSLFLAVRNTIRSRLRSTAIRADYVREAMDLSRSKRQVLILDCCNSGAFPQGTKAEVGGAMGMTRAFQGYGRFVLTASDATQFAWEGNQVIGETENSLFTHFLVKGLQGEADREGDGRITIDELYDYAYEEISKLTPKQTPTKSSTKQEGEIVLRHITRLEDIKPVALPEDLISEIDDTRPYVREVAVQKLEKIVKGRNIGMARTAREALEKIVADDNTTRRVSLMATQILDSIRQAEKEEEERKAREEAERLGLLKAEEERLAREKAEAEAEQKAKQEAERLAAERKAQREAKRLATLKAKEEQERLAREQAEADRKAQEAERLVAEQKAEEESKRLAAVRAKEEQERLAREKAEAERSARKRAQAEAKAPAKAKPIPIVKTVETPAADTAITRPQTLISRPMLYAGIGLVLLIGLALWGNSLRSMSPGTAPTPSETEEPTVDVNAPLQATLPATNTVPVAPPSRTITPSPISTTSSETSDSIPVTGTSVSIASSRAYLYKGPDLTFALAVQIAYPRGEKFTVLGRNASGLWFLCEASDGNQGWLYRDWLDLDFDPLVIPTASFIPTIRPTDRPSGGGGDGSGPVEPQPTCVFC